MNPKCTLSEQQVETLARAIVNMADAILDYYKDPKHESNYQAWHLEKYGYPASDSIQLGDQNKREKNMDAIIKQKKLTYSVTEAAELVGISSTRMYQLARSNGFPSFMVGKRLLISVSGLEKWVEEQTHKRGGRETTG